MDKKELGWVNGFIGMLIFSGSLPATRAALGGFDPLFVTAARAGGAGILGALFLLAFRQRWPTRQEWETLARVALGVVVGFPLLSAFALKDITAAHSLVFVGLLPLSTASFAAALGGERPHPAFWVFSGLGATFVAGYALSQGSPGSLVGDGLMVAAIVICGFGYAEGGRLSRSLGSWQVICWALVLSLPFMLPLAILKLPYASQTIPSPAWVGLAYVTLFSMLVGFFFWYRGLAQGGVASVSQLQLLQPFFGLLLSALLLGESVDLAMIATAAAVILCVAGARRFA